MFEGAPFTTLLGTKLADKIANASLDGVYLVDVRINIRWASARVGLDDVKVSTRGLYC